MSFEGPRDQTPDYGPYPGDGYGDELDQTREFDFGDELPPRRDPGARRRDRTSGGRDKDSDRARRTSRGRGRPGPELGGGRERRPAWQRVAMALGSAVVLLLLVSGGVRAAYSGKALPGTQVGGERVGGQSEDELRDTIRRLASPNRRVSLIGPGRTLQVSALGGGLEADVDATVARALEARRGTFFSPLVAMVGGGANIPLQADVDTDRLRTSVTRVAEAIDRKPYAGALTIDPETLSVQTKASKAGREVDRDALTERLRAALLRPSSGPVTVPVEQTEAVSERGVRDVAEDAEQYLRASLKLTGAGTPYTVSPADLAKLLALEPFDGGRDARLGVDPAELSRLTAKVAAARDRSAKSASISAPARGPIVDGKAEVTWSPKSANVTVNSEGRTGLAVLVKELNGRIRAAVRKGEHTLTVPTKKTNAPVSRASAKKINRVIGTFSTAYIAGQPRRHEHPADREGRRSHDHRARAAVLAQCHRRRANEGQGVRGSALHRRKQDRALGGRRGVAVLDHHVQRRLLRGAADRCAPAAQPLHRSLPSRARVDAELPRHRHEVDQRYRHPDPHPHLCGLGGRDRDALRQQRRAHRDRQTGCARAEPGRKLRDHRDTDREIP